MGEEIAKEVLNTFKISSQKKKTFLSPFKINNWNWNGWWIITRVKIEMWLGSLVFGREVFVSKSELSLSLFWVLLACQVGTVSCVRLGGLRVHHSQGQGLLWAALGRELGCPALPCLHLRSTKMQDLGRAGYERPLPPEQLWMKDVCPCLWCRCGIEAHSLVCVPLCPKQFMSLGITNKGHSVKCK